MSEITKNTSYEITSYLNAYNLHYNKVRDSYWQVPCQHKHANYILHLKLEIGWLHYGAELLTYAPNVHDRSRLKLYEFVLELNQKINAAHIAQEEQKLLLIRNDFTSDINEENLVRGIEYFNGTHEYVYSDLIYKVKELKIRLV